MPFLILRPKIEEIFLKIQNMEKILKFAVFSIVCIAITFSIMWFIQLGSWALCGVIDAIKIPHNSLWLLFLALLFCIGWIINKLATVATNLPYETKYLRLKQYFMVYGTIIFCVYFMLLLILFAGSI